jgi:hypothetical protein
MNTIFMFAKKRGKFTNIFRDTHKLQKYELVLKKKNALLSEPRFS